MDPSNWQPQPVVSPPEFLPVLPPDQEPRWRRLLVIMAQPKALIATAAVVIVFGGSAAALVLGHNINKPQPSPGTSHTTGTGAAAKRFLSMVTGESESQASSSGSKSSTTGGSAKSGGGTSGGGSSSGSSSGTASGTSGGGGTSGGTSGGGSSGGGGTSQVQLKPMPKGIDVPSDRSSYPYGCPPMGSVRVQVGWDQLEPTQGNFTWSPIDSVLNQFSGCDVLVRLIAGNSTPSWVNNIVGPCVQYTNSTTGTELCIPHYWTDPFLNLYQQFVEKLGERYDSNPRVLMISDAACTTEFSEPAIKGNGGGPPLYAAGDSSNGELYCMQRSMADQSAAMPHTRIDVGDNTGWGIPTATGLNFDWPFERSLFDQLRSQYGGQFAPNYHGIADQTSSYTGLPADAPDLFSWMKVIGGPSGGQRGCGSKLPSSECTDSFTANTAINLDVCWFELTTNGSSLSSSQIDSFTQQMSANPGCAD